MYFHPLLMYRCTMEEYRSQVICKLVWMDVCTALVAGRAGWEGEGGSHRGYVG